MAMLRVMTYNILFGGVGREKLLGDAVRTIAPDIAVFCEVTAEDSFRTLADIVGPHRAQSPARGARVAIASRWPITRVDTFGPSWAPRRWVAAVIQPGDGPPLCVCGIHLTPQPLWLCELWRLSQVRVLLGYLRARGGAFHILAGDFNSIAPGDALRRSDAQGWVRLQWWLQAGAIPHWALRALIEAGYRDCYRACNGCQAGFTVNSWAPHARIDYVFASPALAASACSSGAGQPNRPAESSNLARPRIPIDAMVGWKPIPDLGGQASDHLPVWADFEWPPAPGAATGGRIP